MSKARDDKPRCHNLDCLDGVAQKYNGLCPRCNKTKLIWDERRRTAPTKLDVEQGQHLQLAKKIEVMAFRVELRRVQWGRTINTEPRRFLGDTDPIIDQEHWHVIASSAGGGACAIPWWRLATFGGKI